MNQWVDAGYRHVVHAVCTICARVRASRKTLSGWQKRTKLHRTLGKNGASYTAGHASGRGFEERGPMTCDFADLLMTPLRLGPTRRCNLVRFCHWRSRFGEASPCRNVTCCVFARSSAPPGAPRARAPRPRPCSALRKHARSLLFCVLRRSRRRGVAPSPPHNQNVRKGSCFSTLLC